MAARQKDNAQQPKGNSKRKRPGVHSKSKSSKLKASKKYRKKYVGQGR